MSSLIQSMIDACLGGLPSDSALVPIGGAGCAALVGLLLVLKGAKLAPVMTGLILAGVGAWGASAAATAFGVPYWPVVIVGAALGGVLGLALFKIWMSLMLAMCFIAAALAFYGVKVLAPHLEQYQAGRQAAVIEEAASPVGVAVVWDQVSGAWTYLGQNVANFQPSFYAIAVSSGIAGIVFGFLVSAAARALWATTVGTLLALVGTCAVLKLVAPGVLTWLASIGVWGWTIVAGVWAFGLIHNFLDARPRRGKRVTDESAEAAPAA